MSSEPRRCWICSELADTREHKFKRTDVVRVAGSSAPKQAVFLGEHGFQRLQGPSSTLVKLGKVLCRNCNSTRSQPYDRAYEKFSKWAAKDGRSLLGRGEIDFREIYGESYDEQVLMLLRYLAKHLGCRIADDGYPVPGTLKMAFVERDLTPFGVSFAANSQWVNVHGAESVLVNHPLIAVRDLESGQILGPYMSGFSIGYMTIVYRYDFPTYLPWEGELTSEPSQLVQLGVYEPDDNVVFRIGSQDYELPCLWEQQRQYILQQRQNDKMSNEERLDAWLNGVYLILSAGYPKVTKEELMKNLTIPLCEKIWYTTFSLSQIFP